MCEGGLQLDSSRYYHNPLWVLRDIAKLVLYHLLASQLELPTDKRFFILQYTN